MKIELGKTYETRDGHKARVACTDLKGEGVYSVVALVSFDDRETAEEYTPDGDYYDDGEISDNDLVSEWVDPLTVWVAVGPSGAAQACCTSEEIAMAHVQGIGRGWRVVKLVEVPE